MAQRYYSTHFVCNLPVSPGSNTQYNKNANKVDMIWRQMDDIACIVLLFDVSLCYGSMIEYPLY